MKEKNVNMLLAESVTCQEFRIGYAKAEEPGGLRRYLNLVKRCHFKQRLEVVATVILIFPSFDLTVFDGAFWSDFRTRFSISVGDHTLRKDRMRGEASPQSREANLTSAE
jgi:hypothetical protein